MMATPHLVAISRCPTHTIVFRAVDLERNRPSDATPKLHVRSLDFAQGMAFQSN